MREDYKELVTSMGWKNLVAALETRKANHLNLLSGVGDWDKVVRLQAAIAEINYLIKLPHELLQGVKDENEKQRE